MRTVRPRNPVDLPLSGRDCEADGAAYFTVAPVRRDSTDPERCCWLLCDEADAEMVGLYAAGSGPSVWISDHPTRAAAERAKAAAQRERVA